MYIQKYIAILIFICAVKSMASVNDFHCKPKQGCQISQCEPVSLESLEQNVSMILERNEFPIVCKAGEKLHKVLSKIQNSDFDERQEKNFKDSLIRELTEIMDKKLSPIIDRMDKLESKFSAASSNQVDVDPNNQNENLETFQKKNCEIKYKHTCFWIIQGAFRHDHAVKMCENANATLASIYSESHLKLLTEVLKRKRLATVWIGLKAFLEKGNVILKRPDGMWQEYEQWDYDFPMKTQLSRGANYIMLGTRGKASTYGMRNRFAIIRTNGAICEYEI